jgi:hypothetical protein
MPQTNSLHSCAKQTKMSFFKNSFSLLYKIGEQEGGLGPVWGAHMYVNGKMISVTKNQMEKLFLLKLFYEWQEGKDGEWWRDSSVIYVIY